MPKPVRIQNKKYGTVLRIIRTVARGTDLYWVCRDETYGGLCWLSVDNWSSGDWEVEDA